MAARADMGHTLSSFDSALGVKQLRVYNHASQMLYELDHHTIMLWQCSMAQLPNIDTEISDIEYRQCPKTEELLTLLTLRTFFYFGRCFKMFSTEVALLLALLTFSAPQLQAASSPYADCVTNFETLEMALVKTDDNKYALQKAFYPPRKSTAAVYVNVTYTFLDEYGNDTSCNSKWIWSSHSIYLIQPPPIFQFTSLFFSFT